MSPLAPATCPRTHADGKDPGQDVEDADEDGDEDGEDDNNVLDVSSF